MGRKVSVSLEADVVGFVGPVKVATESADELGDKVEKLDDELNKLPADAAKAAAALKLLGGSVDDVGTKVDSLGEKSTGLAVLDSKIRATRGEVKKLADEFVKTGDIDVFKKLGEAQGRLQALGDVRKKLADALTPDNLAKDLVKDGEKAAEGFFKGALSKINDYGDELAKTLPSMFSGALSTPVLGPIIAAAIIAALVAAVSTVLATAGGVVLAAGGAGIVGAGILGGILGNPTVVGAAWQKTVEGIKAQFLTATQPFQEPLLQAAHDFASAIGGIDMAHIFGEAAKFLPQLAKGAADFARSLGQGVGFLIDAAGPGMADLGKDLSMLGHAIATALHSIAGGSEGGAQALHDLLGAVSVLITGLGGLIGFFEKLYGYMAKVRDYVLPHDWFFPSDAPERLDNGARSLEGVGDAAKSTVVDLDEMNSKLNETVTTMDSLEAAIVGKIFAATMGLDQAVLGVNESLTKLTDSFKENGRTLDIHTAKGQANRESVLSVVTANMSLYQAQLAAGMSAEDAAAAYDESTAALEAQLRKIGLTQGQIDGLIGKYRGIPKKVDTDIAINGLTSAINGLSDLIRQINGIHDKTVTIYYRTQGQSQNAPLAHGGIRRAAVGMVIPPSDPGTTLVGEPQTGGEALIPLRGISSGRAMSLAQTVGNAYGFSVSTSRGHAEARALTVAFVGSGSRYTQLLAQTLQEMQRTGQLQLSSS